MKYKIVYSNHFEKDYARCKKRGYDLSILRKAYNRQNELYIFLKRKVHLFDTFFT